MDKERKTDRRYAAADNDGDPKLSDEEIAQLRTQAQSARRAPIRKLLDGRIVMDLGLARFNDDVASVDTAYEVPTEKGERHSKGGLPASTPVDRLI